MKVLVRFEDDYGYVSMVGMNNLFIIEDRRIKTGQGIRNRVDHLITIWHPYRLNQIYRVYLYETEEFLFRGKNAMLWDHKQPEKGYNHAECIGARARGARASSAI